MLPHELTLLLIEEIQLTCECIICCRSFAATIVYDKHIDHVCHIWSELIWCLNEQAVVGLDVCILCVLHITYRSHIKYLPILKHLVAKTEINTGNCLIWGSHSDDYGNTIIWDVMPCRLIEFHQCFGGNVKLIQLLASCSLLA